MKKNIVFLILLFYLFSVPSHGVYLFKKSIGMKGTEILQFNYPVCIFFRDDKYYISDWKNNRVQIIRENWVFDKLITDIPEPVGIVSLSSGEIIVASKSSSTLYKFDKDGNLLIKLGKEGIKKGEYYHPRGLAVDEKDYIYVADYGNRRVQKIDKEGKVYQVYEYLKNGKRCYPRSCALDNDGNLYVVYSQQNEIVKFSPDGKILKVINQKESQYPPDVSQFRYVTVDVLGNLFVTDYEMGRILRFNKYGKFEEIISQKGTSKGKLLHPEGLIALYNGTLVVCNSDNDRIEIFTSDEYIRNYELAIFYQQKGDEENALKYYEATYSYNPKNEDVISYLKKAYRKKIDEFYRKEKFEKALYYCNKLIDIDPEERAKLKRKIDNIKFKINRWLYILFGVVVIILIVFIYLFWKIS